MHATPHTNLFGITTHYGTHPTPTRRLELRARHAARTAARAAATTLLAAALLAKQRLAKTK